MLGESHMSALRSALAYARNPLLFGAAVVAVAAASFYAGAAPSFAADNPGTETGAVITVKPVAVAARLQCHDGASVLPKGWTGYEQVDGILYGAVGDEIAPGNSLTISASPASAKYVLALGESVAGASWQWVDASHTAEMIHFEIPRHAKNCTAPRAGGDDQAGGARVVRTRVARTVRVASGEAVGRKASRTTHVSKAPQGAASHPSGSVVAAVAASTTPATTAPASATTLAAPAAPTTASTTAAEVDRGADHAAVDSTGSGGPWQLLVGAAMIVAASLVLLAVRRRLGQRER